MFKGLIEAGLGIFTGFMERKHEKAMAKHKVIIAQETSKAKIAEKTATADIDWDQTMAVASGSSWKDEFWTIVLALPFMAVFIPGAQEYVKQGFEVLQTHTPDWYRYALLTMISASVGVSQLRKFKR